MKKIFPYLSPFLILLVCVSNSQAQTDTALYPVTVKGKTGYMNAAGKMVVPPQYQSGNFFEKGYAVATNTELRQGAINVRGEVVVPFMYKEIYHWPNSDWWVATTGDSLRIFRLREDKDIGDNIYWGRGISILAYPDINRFVICEGMFVQEQTTRLMDFSGKLIAEVKGPKPTQFEDISGDITGPPNRYNRYGLSLIQGTQCSITDLNGRVIYEDVSVGGFQDGLAPVYGKQRCAVMDTTLKEVIPFSAGYRAIEILYGTPYFLVTRKDSTVGIIDLRQTVVIPFKLQGRLHQHNTQLFELYDLSDSIIYKVYDYNGNLVAHHQRRQIEIGYGKLCFPVPLKENDSIYRLWKGGFLKEKYSFVSPYNKDGYALFRQGKKQGLLDSNGAVVLITDYPILALPQDGILAAGERVSCPQCKQHPYAQVGGNGKENWAYQFFYLNLKGARINKTKYNFVYPFRDGRAWAIEDNNYELLNRGGKPVSGSNLYKYKTHFAHGVRIVADTAGQQALMNESGKRISDWQYSFRMKEVTSSTFDFYENDRKLRSVVNKELQPDFVDGRILFEGEPGTGLMDTLGQIIVPSIYNSISPAGKNYLIVRKKEKSGLLDQKGRQILPIEWDKISPQGRFFLLQQKEAGTEKVFVPPHE